MAEAEGETEEDLADYRPLVARSTNDFLDAICGSEGVQTNGQVREFNATDPRQVSNPDFFNSGALNMRFPVSMVKSQILPINFTLYSKARDKAVTFMLLLNPITLNYGNTNAVQATYTRQGYVTQLWGNNLKMLSSTGKTAGFMVASEGLTNVVERQSLAYRNFAAVLAAYRNNGWSFFDPTAAEGSTTGSSTRVIQYVEGIMMEYDGNSFLGHFNNFTLDDTADHPFCINYSFEFLIDAVAGDDSEIRGHYGAGLNGFSNAGVTDINAVNAKKLVGYVTSYMNTQRLSHPGT